MHRDGQIKRAPLVTDDDEEEIQRRIASDHDAPEITDEQWAKAMTFEEALPELAAALRRSRGRPPVENPKETISIRLSRDVLEHYRGTGKGWQTRIEEILRKAMG